MNAPEVKVKKYICIPRDALELLSKRYASMEEASDFATEQCAETGQSIYVVEMKAIAARADRPVKVSKL